MTTEPKKVGIIGTGLLGGALALLIGERCPSCELFAIETNSQHKAILKNRMPQIEFCDTYLELKECKYIFIGTPPATIVPIALEILEIVGEDTIIIDMASTKLEIVSEILEKSVNSQKFIGGHPLSGGNLIGPEGSGSKILEEAIFLLTPHEGNSQGELQNLSDFLNLLSFDVRITSSSKHDEILAITSHLPHLMSYAYSSLLLEYGTNGANKFDDLSSYASRSTRQTAHFASANTEMWADIFCQNHKEVSVVLDEYILVLMKMRNAFGGPTPTEIKTQLEAGNRGRLFLQKGKST